MTKVPRTKTSMERHFPSLLGLALCGVAACSVGSAPSGSGSREANAAVVEVESVVPTALTPPDQALPPEPLTSAEGTKDALPEEPEAPPADAPRYPSGAAKWARTPAPTDVPRIYAKTRNVWIKGKPDNSGQWIGFLWFGTSVPLKSTEPVAGPGCAKWYEIEPRGFVCGDGKRATLDPEDPLVRELYPYGAVATSANPHPFYGESIGAERYISLPTANSQSVREWDYRKRMARIAEARAGEPRVDSLLGIDLSPATEPPPVLPQLPSNLQMPHRTLIPRSTVAWMREAHFEGRDFLLTDDLTWVPKDRVKPYPEVTFRGVHLGEQVNLPLAFFREQDQPKYERNGDTFVDTGERYARLSWIELGSETWVTEEGTFYATKDGHWVREDQAVIPKLAEKTPWNASVGKEDDSGEPQRGRATWIEVSVLGGWMIAYEGTTPVFTTLMSPGQGGVPQRGRPPLETSATPTGRFKITGKFVTSTMIAPNDLTHSAVPWAQNFSGPYAIHGAYWHNEWGERKSGGCINLSPQDSRFMFEWTEPRIPEGWHGVRWLPNHEAATTLIVRK